MDRFVLSNPIQALVATGMAGAAALILLRGRRRIIHGRLPPGPVPLPLFGSLFSIDAKKPWVTYTEWAARYCDIYMVRVLRQNIIVLNSERIAKDLFEHRSNIYSDRPYLATREPKARQLVLDILNAPRDHFDHIQRFSASVILSIVYDYEVKPGHDHIVELIERGNALAGEALTPETASVIEAFPFFLSLPKWFPGAVIRRKADVCKDCAIKMVEVPFEYATSREAADASNDTSMALDLLKRVKDPSQLQILKDTCATAFAAGAETTIMTLRCFMLAMLQHPKAQKQAQAEIDAVVGTNRLPNFDDRPNLPYTDAILMETLRMYSVVPLGVAHATIADDIYEGLFIPKGSTVVANVWGMHHNEDIYPEPDLFKPERFLLDSKLGNIKSVDVISFGFGRRVCPGRFAADSSVWVAMVSILSAFNITKALNELGEEIEFEPTFTYGVTSAPEPFPCSIVPRHLNTDALATVDI